MSFREDAAEIVRLRRPATCPVYQPWRRESVEAVGSAVLLATGFGFFAVTANHVLSELAQPDIFFGGDDLAGGSRAQFVHTVGSDDRFDLAFAALVDEQVAAIGRHRFLSIENLSVADVPDTSRPHGSKYVAMGYPSKQNPPHTGRLIEPRAMSVFARPADASRYAEVNATASAHLVLEFDRKEAVGDNGPLTSPKLNGMSGCGVWSGPSGHSGATKAGCLVAILTEHHENSKKLIVATRVGVLLDGLLRGSS